MTANKTRATAASKARALALSSVAPLAFAEGKARLALIDMVKRAGGNLPAVRNEVIAGRMASRIPSNHDEATRIDNARAIMALPGKGSKEAKRRTEAQEAAYGAARGFWSSVLKEAGIASSDKRGGDTSAKRKPRVTKANQAKAKKATGATGQQAAPKARDAGELLGFFKQQSAMMLALSNKNAGLVKTDWHKMIVCCNDYFQSVALED